jgi:hypothetical protein
MVVKLYMDNAFDNVRDAFLFQVMEQFGFSTNSIRWIAACINNPWITPLVNGRTTNLFQDNIGLHQGCPLYPLFFIIVVEALIKKLEQERENGNIPGLQISQGVKIMNHSQFANDTLLLGGAFEIIASRMKSTLDSFLDAHKGNVNNMKCQVFGWNTSPQVMWALDHVF